MMIWQERPAKRSVRYVETRTIHVSDSLAAWISEAFRYGVYETIYLDGKRWAASEMSHEDGINIVKIIEIDDSVYDVL